MSTTPDPSPPGERAVDGDGQSSPRTRFVWPKGRDVHVWRLDLRHGPEAGMAVLDERERWKAQAFAYVDDRRRYTAAHVAMRRILAAYVGLPAQALCFVEGECGKPLLLRARGTSDRCLGFNLSYSKDAGLLAIAAGQEVGVDIEAVPEHLPGTELAANLLCRAELAALAVCGAAEQPQAFVRCWTRKEACLKALGVHRGPPPDGLRVGLESGRARVRLHGREVEVMSLPVPVGYCAAVATLGGLGRIQWHVVP